MKAAELVMQEQGKIVLLAFQANIFCAVFVLTPVLLNIPQKISHALILMKLLAKNA